MPTTVLSVASRAVLDACTRLGLDAARLLAAAGLEPGAVMDPDARIPAERADALWRHAFAAAADPQLALHAAEALPFGAYKVLDFVAANAPTVGEGLRRIARYFALVDPRGSLTITDAEPMRVGMESTQGAVPAAAQEYTFAALVLRSRAASGVGWTPAAVELTGDAPFDASEHARIFGCPVRFARPAPRLLVLREHWDRPVHGADPALFSVLEDHAERLLAELPAPEPPLVSRLRAVLREELRGGDVGVEHVARRLALGARTLQRRLEDEGVRFAEVLAELRTELARDYLREPGLSIAEIAWLLGFSEQSAFTRAFKRATGQPPGAWRAAHS
ncbi:MAG: AraC family transcriptional regulator ligand-binding domain-containing protein [Myxococcales bacterium]|nr:AraC family transcriptional regulator ligand-binding domain-containing protein [Myxococcales bacterium]